MIIVVEAPNAFICEICGNLIDVQGEVDERNQLYYTMEEVTNKWMDHQLSDECKS